MPPANPSASQRLPGDDTLDPAAQLRGLLERAAGAGSWTLEVNFRRLSWTEPLAELLEMPRDVAPAFGDALSFYAPESRALMAAALEACRGSATPFDETVQIITARGRRVWVRSLGEGLRDASGSVVRIQGVLQDLTAKKRAEQESLRLTMRLSTTLASITDVFVTLDREGRFTYVNRESERLLGRTSAELLGQIIWRELDGSGGSRLRRELLEALRSGQNIEFEEFYSGLGKWLELRVYPFEEGLAVYFRDVSDRRRAQEQMLLLQTSISRLNDVVLITEAGSIDAPGPRIVFVNDAFERNTGYSRDEVLGQTPRMLQGPLTQRPELDRIRAALQQSQPVRAELINYKKNGELFWLELEIVPVDYFSRGLTHWIAVGRDVTERKAAEDEIEYLAFYDALTQLPNRQLLMDRLQRALSQGVEHTKIGALMFIDLDHFKVLNDTLGHSKGDLLLQKVASRLSACVRASDTVARLGGDEFVVMLEDLGENSEAVTARTKVIGEQILAALIEPYDLAGHQHHSTCSIGITLFSSHQQSIGDLLKQADLAMYQAKAAGRNAVCFFDPEMQAAVTANAALNSELRQGLRDHEFLLHYQPQVGRYGRMIGVEALVRWQHPQRQLIFPDAFISQAEESGLILPLGQWVLETACAQLATWAKRPETENLSIAVNVSVRQFRHPEFVDLVMTAINQAGIDAQRLKLELTETLLATDIDVTIAKMGMLKNAGVTLSIDDFGMGYSALSYLKHLPLDQLKIDRSFVKDVLTDPNDAAIARTIIGLAQSLGLAVMAEGVETEAQREFLNRHGCECYQGYLFCKALPIDELEVFMQGLAL
ncbi:MAG: EAL domain-containing protein [Polaromonas sp.]|uniref:sensor domain-containing protein n=1 Tax=Polaromonas sp. TaxID=1869339 RepID=UPI0017EF6FFF|nr:EAL domain-containing protein [Polaromonas sp.]NMM09585.1 EAL domain-containing protein [Polaromonas sp.]